MLDGLEAGGGFAGALLGMDVNDNFWVSAGRVDSH